VYLVSRCSACFPSLPVDIGGHMHTGHGGGAAQGYLSASPRCPRKQMCHASSLRLGSDRFRLLGGTATSALRTGRHTSPRHATPRHAARPGYRLLAVRPGARMLSLRAMTRLLPREVPSGWVMAVRGQDGGPAYASSTVTWSGV
jgi:hypothetical protein